MIGIFAWHAIVFLIGMNMLRSLHSFFNINWNKILLVY